MLFCSLTHRPTGRMSIPRSMCLQHLVGPQARSTARQLHLLVQGEAFHDERCCVKFAWHRGTVYNELILQLVLQAPLTPSLLTEMTVHISIRVVHHAVCGICKYSPGCIYKREWIILFNGG